MHTFPAVFPVRVGEEARQNFGVEVALAFEVAVKSAVREISSPLAARTLVKPRARPPNVMATPAISCRRVGEFAGAS